MSGPKSLRRPPHRARNYSAALKPTSIARLTPVIMWNRAKAAARLLSSFVRRSIDMTLRLPSKILPSARRFYLVVSLLILFAGSVYFSNVGRVGFVTHDERSLNLEATSIREHGLSQLF